MTETPFDHPPTRPRRPRRRPGRWVAFGITVLLLGGLVALSPWDPSRRQAYADQLVVWTEPPSEQITRLAERIELTETGRRIFFASRPQLDQADDFQAHCPVEAEVVLGCYYRSQIYVYDVTDERLAGTVEATAAHELLHAVYDRMTPEQRAPVDALIAQYVATLPETDRDVKIVATYPEDQRADEWHSRLGNSHERLPDALETHYAEVFSNRAQVVGYATRATQQLDGYTSRIDQLSAELDTTSGELQSRSAAYDAASAALDADIAAFNARADAGTFDSQAQFDAERAKLVARQNTLESDRVQLNADVDAYNAKVEELTSLDAQRAELYAKLDSRSAPAS
ncbi:MAG: hypothetical protein DI534_02240 [Leifsonia xyli]|nr:MAG: hypothetical protein DI534_02240 [Leifsonia xyli]